MPSLFFSLPVSFLITLTPLIVVKHERPLFRLTGWEGGGGWRERTGVWGGTITLNSRGWYPPPTRDGSSSLGLWGNRKENSEMW